MKYVLLFVHFVVLFSCNENKGDGVVTIERDGMILKGNITSDTIFNDTINYYNLNHELISKKVFKENKQEGISTEYYLNGRPMMVTSYSDGLKNGYNSYFDSTSGLCFYRDFYYYGLTMGPVQYFDPMGNPKTYFFVNLENETLLHINYLKWNGIGEVHQECINFTSNYQRTDSTKKVSILLYLMDPPKFSFSYSILKKKKESESDFVKVKNLSSNLPFINVLLPTLPPTEHYAIGLNIFDSLLNKETVIYKDL